MYPTEKHGLKFNYSKKTHLHDFFDIRLKTRFLCFVNTTDWRGGIKKVTLFFSDEANIRYKNGEINFFSFLIILCLNKCLDLLGYKRK
jgi:hypothetical protein